MRVERNGGAPGVDGMTVEQLRSYLKRHWPEIRAALDAETYQPKPVLRHEIPTVIDRLIQQAPAQVLTPLPVRLERWRMDFKGDRPHEGPAT